MKSSAIASTTFIDLRCNTFDLFLHQACLNCGSFATMIIRRKRGGLRNVWSHEQLRENESASSQAALSNMTVDWSKWNTNCKNSCASHITLKHSTTTAVFFGEVLIEKNCPEKKWKDRLSLQRPLLTFNVTFHPFSHQASPWLFFIAFIAFVTFVVVMNCK